MDNADLIRDQCDLAVDYLFEEKFYIFFCFDFLIFSVISGSAVKTVYCFIQNRALLKPFCTVDRSCAKLFLCTAISTLFVVPIWCL